MIDFFLFTAIGFFVGLGVFTLICLAVSYLEDILPDLRYMMKEFLDSLLFTFRTAIFGLPERYVYDPEVDEYRREMDQLRQEIIRRDNIMAHLDQLRQATDEAWHVDDSLPDIEFSEFIEEKEMQI